MWSLEFLARYLLGAILAQLYLILLFVIYQGSPNFERIEHEVKNARWTILVLKCHLLPKMGNSNSRQNIWCQLRKELNYQSLSAQNDLEKYLEEWFHESGIFHLFSVFYRFYRQGLNLNLNLAATKQGLCQEINSWHKKMLY